MKPNSYECRHRKAIIILGHSDICKLSPDIVHILKFQILKWKFSCFTSEDKVKKNKSISCNFSQYQQPGYLNKKASKVFLTCDPDENNYSVNYFGEKFTNFITWKPPTVWTITKKEVKVGEDLTLWGVVQNWWRGNGQS